MRDVEAERRFPAPMYQREARARCPSCGALPSVRYRTIVDAGDGLVVTCSAYYCRARAAEFARTS